MLDDLKYIHTKDSADALGWAAKQPMQLLEHYGLVGDLPTDVIQDIVFAGMGGSALAAHIVQAHCNVTIPSEIWKRYGVPSYVNGKSMLIAISYSGTTEETLDAVATAEARDAKIVIIASGGDLIELARTKGYPYIQLPTSAQPRLMTCAIFRSLVVVLRATNTIKSTATAEDYDSISFALNAAAKLWAPDIETKNNPAKQLALELAGTSPIIYAGNTLQPAALKWKLACNEAAKNASWYGELPEFSHNEFTGWASHPIDKPFSIVQLQSSFDHERVTHRFNLTNKLLSGRQPHPHIIHGEGSSPLEQTLHAMLLGDFVSMYIALLNGVDPSELSLVAKFKAKL